MTTICSYFELLSSTILFTKMSLIPYFLRDAWDDLNGYLQRPDSLFDQHFGMGVFNDDLLNPNWITGLPHRYRFPFANQSSCLAVPVIQNSKDCFKVNVDVQQFKPDEIIVKTTDKYVVVEGKHEEHKDEHGYISRHFQRRYRLPDDVDPKNIVSKLSSDGVLSVEAPKMAASLPDKERNIPITCTNTPAAIAQQPQEDLKKKSKM